MLNISLNLLKHLKIPSFLSKMANSKYDYVRQFELEDKLVLNTWIVVRIDGKHFHKFSEKHKFEKPNDLRAIKLMNKAAIRVMGEFKDILIAYGQSDEYSFVLRRDSTLYNRRSSKIMTYINSLFTSSYVFYWKDYFGDGQKLMYPPSFDSRVVLYPTNENLKDYLSWRQVDCHINNLYNTTFWNLVKGGLTNAEAEQRLCGTLSSDKNEILFSEFNKNYNNEPEIFKKGTVIIRKKLMHPKSGKLQQIILPLHVDIIQDQFWESNPEILDIRTPTEYSWPQETPLPVEILNQMNIFENNLQSFITEGTNK